MTYDFLVGLLLGGTTGFFLGLFLGLVVIPLVVDAWATLARSSHARR